MHTNAIDRIGHTYGHFTVTAYVTTIREPGKTRLLWLCRCSCGNYRVIPSNGFAKANSCGCWQKAHPARLRHGFSGTRMHRSWTKIIGRCLCKTDAAYHHYGGRGITVCARWLESFENFYADMGEPPTPKHSIDRIDNDGPYSPENCRWATQAEQVANRRNTLTITIDGVAKGAKEWASIAGISYSNMVFRYQKSGIRGRDLLLPRQSAFGFKKRQTAIFPNKS